MKTKKLIHTTGSLLLSGVMMIGAVATSLSPLGAVETQAQASPWSQEKAIHLAHRALISPTQEDIDALISAGNVDAAVELLFEAPSSADQFYYDQDLDEFYDEANLQSSFHARESYVVQRWKNPDEAREKLFLLFEDILTVDLGKLEGGQQNARAHYVDWHHTIYDSLDGSYKELVKRTMREFAQAHYLNLLNGNKYSPNQDFAREFLQLFLMEERGPFETDINVRHYTEQEMINMSFLVTGYRYSGNYALPSSVKNRADDNRYISFTKPNGDDSIVWFDRHQHNTTARELFGEMVSTPQGQDPAEVVTEYIFGKKEDAIADFIGWKLVNHYVNVNPTPSEVAVAAQILKDNDFHIVNSAKALLKHDIMYSNAALNQFRYKSPVELIIGMLQKFNPEFTISEFYNGYLPYLDFTALGAPTIFGRDGMDENDLWMDSAKYGSWVSKLSYSLPQKLLGLPCTQDFEGNCTSPSKNDLKKQAGESDSDYFNRLWTFINPGKTVDPVTQSYFETLISGIVGGEMSDQELYTLLGDIFSQPEYLLLSGESIAPEGSGGSPFPNDHVVIYHWMNGAPDMQHLFIPVHDNNYELIKGKMAVDPQYQADLVDKNGDTNELYRVNKYAFGQDMLDYYESGNLYIMNGAGLIGQSQAHNAARTQTETGTLSGSTGYLTRVFQDYNSGEGIPSNQIQKRAFSKLMNGMASSSIPNSNVSTGLTGSSSENLTSLFDSRALPGKTNLLIPAALDVASLVQTENLDLSTIQGRFDYFLKLVDTQDGLIMTDQSGGFDSHRDQAPYLVGRTANGSTRVDGLVGVENRFRYSMDLYAETFEKFKTQYPDKELTIVMYGEFGRTTVPNATLGTDHGRGGLFLFLTTDETLMKDSSGNDLPQLIGRMNTNDNQLNYQDVKIEKRSIWNHLFQHVYNKNIFTTAGEENPLPLETYVELDELYDLLQKGKEFDDAAISAAITKVSELKTELSSNTFATNFFLGRLEEVNNHFARGLSLPNNHESLFSSFSFENNIGDGSYHAQQLKVTGDVQIDYTPGISGQGLLLQPGEQYDNDKYDIFTKVLDNREEILSSGNTIFFWVSPETIASDGTIIFENKNKGARVSLSSTGSNGGKKLTVDYMNGTSVTSVLSAGSPQSPELKVGEWAHVGIISNVSGKKFTVLINGQEVASRSNPPSFANNYRYQFGSTDTSGSKHSVIVDEFNAFGRVYSVAEAQIQYALDALRNSGNVAEVTSFLESLPEDHDEQERIASILGNIDRPNMPSDMGVFPGSEAIANNINECLAGGSTYPVDGKIKLRWKEENLFTNEAFFRQSISPVFLQGVDDGSIDFEYDQESKVYTFDFNGNDEELWSCYFEESPFFLKFFDFVE